MSKQTDVKKIVDKIVKIGLRESSSGNYIFFPSDIEELKDQTLALEIYEELCERKEVADVELNSTQGSEELDVMFYTDYLGFNKGRGHDADKAWKKFSDHITDEKESRGSN